MQSQSHPPTVDYTANIILNTTPICIVINRLNARLKKALRAGEGEEAQRVLNMSIAVEEAFNEVIIGVDRVVKR